MPHARCQVGSLSSDDDAKFGCHCGHTITPAKTFIPDLSRTQLVPAITNACFANKVDSIQLHGDGRGGVPWAAGVAEGGLQIPASTKFQVNFPDTAFV